MCVTWRESLAHLFLALRIQGLNGWLSILKFHKFIFRLLIKFKQFIQKPLKNSKLLKFINPKSAVELGNKIVIKGLWLHFKMNFQATCYVNKSRTCQSKRPPTLHILSDRER